MKTLESDNNLIQWKQNENMAGIKLSELGGDIYFLGENYYGVFSEIAERLKKGVPSFISTWMDLCDGECSKVFQKIRLASPSADAESVLKIVNKFRGNLGEIMIETLAEHGILDFVQPGTYVPVNPLNEEYVDAEAVRNGLPIGIQIKNYSKQSRVGRDVFVKAAAMSDIWLRRDKKISDDDIMDFIKTPCQYIISTVKPDNILYIDNYKGSVVFLGPTWFESKKIQGSIKTSESSMWKMFKYTADKIKTLTDNIHE